MSVIRVHKNKNFTVMSNHHFKEKKMSLKSKGLLSMMLSLPDDWNYSVSGLVTLSKDGKDSVMSALIELEKFGYLKRTRVKNESGQFAGVEYDIFEEPQKEFPVEEKPTSAAPTEEKSSSEKPPQLNTNSIKDLENKLLYELNTNDGELIGLYREYIQARDNMQVPLNELGLERLIKRAKRLSKNNIKVEKLLLETAIINGWKNVFTPSETELKLANEETINDLKSAFGLE